MNKIREFWRKIDLFSLRLRLTIGIGVVSALGNSSIAIWTSWKMQQILIDSQKNHVEKIAARLPNDVKLYSEMIPLETGLQKAINNLTNTNSFLWVQKPNRQILAQST
ncbi:MAG: two-component sensor histidine kinase, partial [Microcystaceae cyanobacterium]